MKFLLIMHMNPEVWEGLSEETRDSVMTGHADFIAKIRESGELVNTQALGTPGESAVVRVRGGVPAVTDGPFIESKEFLAGFYLVECASRERALEVAAMIPDAAIEGLGIEVRPIAFFADAESETEFG
ncbi:MAG TPA: YciI family protein [Amycolatopsis sp.]|nr:YciI family protein [Amycolatopsis sp.]